MTKKPTISRVLIANRGEIALRAVRVCHALGIEAVAVYSAPDAASPHVWAADRAVCIGPAAATSSYLSVPALLHVANETTCDAVYPGYGFLAENAGFAEQCADNGLKFIGPAAQTIRDMGDKARAREVAVEMGVPVVPGSGGAYLDLHEAQAASAEIGYPMLLKARSGGGGRGMRIVEHDDEFAGAFNQATREAEAAFSDGALYIERFFSAVRHIEVQVLGDGKGAALVFDERDCSVQRRHQKLVEESPSPVVPASVRERLLDVAKRLTEGLKYEGAGTVEFIFDTATNDFFFIEMNTRIQVEHPVTECRVGLDLVKAQFQIAATGALPEYDPTAAAGGHAIEFRINAEDWQHGFRPSPGRLEKWRVPLSKGVRMDTAAYEGQSISPFYDSMIAKLIVHGKDRTDALARARRVFDGIQYEGIEMTAGFHRWLLDQDAFIENNVHTRWLETEGNMPQAGVDDA